MLKWLILLLVLCVLVLPFQLHRRPALRHWTRLRSSVAAIASHKPMQPATALPKRRKPLDTNFTIEVAQSRSIHPGDYVAHQDYGVGKFLGVRQVQISRINPSSPVVPVVVIKYRDGELTIYQRFAPQELWMYSSAQGGIVGLDSLVDVKAWSKRKQRAASKSQEIARNLVNLLAVRNSILRTPCKPDDDKFKAFEARFAYAPTVDQMICFDQIAEDMIYKNRPMDRLICGDVGFGKTEVAMRAAYRTVLSDKQVVFLAPTKILAQQHFTTIKKRMPDVSVELLQGQGTGNSAALNNATRQRIASGQCQVAVGTHALLSKSLSFHNLGLIVIDEEQRFGVGHKERLKTIATGVDVLTLTATPIPRTLQTSLSGLREMTHMKTPPPGRKEVVVMTGKFNQELLRKGIAREKERGGQVFIVVPFIHLMRNVSRMLEEIGIDVNNDVIEVDGRRSDMTGRISAFLDREATILLSTTVIEIGVDMPNVNTLFVLDADHFGISTLHQLRGRVGRCDRQAYAYFLTSRDQVTQSAKLRLENLELFTFLGAGFELAKRDLEMRGYGTLFGYKQTGMADIGPDLECKYLSDELKLVKQTVILPIDSTLLVIEDDVEAYGELIGYKSISVANDTVEALKYEFELPKKMARDCLSEEEYSLYRTAFKKLNVLKDIEALGTSLAQFNFSDKAFKVTLAVLMRAKVRALALRAAIKSIVKSQDGYVLDLHEQHNPEKWQRIHNSISSEFHPLVELISEEADVNMLKLTISTQLSPQDAMQTLVRFLYELNVAVKKLLEDLHAEGESEVVEIDSVGSTTSGLKTRKKRRL